jgi:hypothetical protein
MINELNDKTCRLFIDVISDTGDNIVSEARSWIRAKESSFFGNALKEQLVKNLIYLYKVADLFNTESKLGLVMSSQIPQSDEQIMHTVARIKMECRSEVQAQVNYVMNGCHSCDYHHLHNIVSDLKTSDIDRLKSLAFMAQINHAFAFNVMMCIWTNPRLQGMLSTHDVTKVNETYNSNFSGLIQTWASRGFASLIF